MSARESRPAARRHRRPAGSLRRPTRWPRGVDGEPVEDDLAERIDTPGRRLVEYANIEPDPRTAEAVQNVGAED